MSDIPKIINAPNIIFLQIGEDYLDGEEVDFHDLNEVTWCANSISDTELAYVPKERAERAEANNSYLQAKLDEANALLGTPGFLWRERAEKAEAENAALKALLEEALLSYICVTDNGWRKRAHAAIDAARSNRD